MTRQTLCTSKLHCFLPWLISCLAFYATLAQALQCPAQQVPGPAVHSHTQRAVERLDQVFQTYTATNGIEPLEIERDTILIEFDSADQTLFVARLCTGYCMSLAMSDLTPKEELMQTADDTLCARIKFRDIVAATRDPYVTGLSGPISLLAAYDDQQSRNAGVGMTGFRALTVAAVASEEKPDYLLEPPYVVNRNNKNFVIVASAPTRDGAINEMNRLKRKAPQHDFIVYAPYRGNPNYAIMMATWVSWDVAQQALEDAQLDVKSDAFIWSCRSLGRSC